MNLNYLLFMPSLMQDNCSPIEYSAVDTNTVFTGLQTNIPATEYIIDKLASRQEKLQKIILLCSGEVIQKNIVSDMLEAPMTTYEYYVQTISACMAKYGYSETEIKNAFFQINLQNVNPGDRRSMESVQSIILNQIAEAEEKHLFLDYTGGLRSASMLLLLFARLLENWDVRVEDVLYSSIYRERDGKRRGQIESCMDTYRLFDYLDAFTNARSGNLNLLGQLTSAKGDTALANAIQSTMEAMKKAQYGKFSEISKSDKDTIPDTGGRNLVDDISIELINIQRVALTPEDSVKGDVTSGNVISATQKIREQGLQMLIEKKYIIWRSELFREKDKQNSAFFAYAHYYRSYLDFVGTMLLQIGNAPYGDLLWDAYQKYINEKYQLLPAVKSNGNISQTLENEFDYVCADTADYLKQALTERIQSNPKNADFIISAVEAYRQERRKYITSYMQTGFPFANVFKTWSYSKCKRQWYDESYKEALELGMHRLCDMPDERRVDLIQAAVKDTLILSGLFPPVQFDALFWLKDRNFAGFGEKALLMDSIRTGRNLFTHSGEKVTDEDIKRGNKLVADFITWVETL